MGLLEQPRTLVWREGELTPPPFARRQHYWALCLSPLMERRQAQQPRTRVDPARCIYYICGAGRSAARAPPHPRPRRRAAVLAMRGILCEVFLYSRGLRCSAARLQRIHLGPAALTPIRSIAAPAYSQSAVISSHAAGFNLQKRASRWHAESEIYL
jgi:hypothetical protein